MSLAPRAGIGLRFPHLPQVMAEKPAIAWFEVHSENFLSEGGPRLRALEAIRQDYPVACHGVGLSLGSAEGLDPRHLERLRRLFDRVAPAIVSEHASWSVSGGVYLNDLLPLPYTDEALEVFCANVDCAQAAFGRRILVENPSSYLRLAASAMPEWEFLNQVVRRTGCGILLDLNNIYVSAHNVGLDAASYLENIEASAVAELHLAGHRRSWIDNQPMLIDDHGSRVPDPVWRLYEQALARLGAVPTLIEWDTDVPPLALLQDEANRAEARLAPAR